MQHFLDVQRHASSNKQLVEAASKKFFASHDVKVMLALLASFGAAASLFRRIATDFAAQALQFADDERSTRALEVARLFADGKASDAEMQKASREALLAFRESTNGTQAMARIAVVNATQTTMCADAGPALAACSSARRAIEIARFANKENTACRPTFRDVVFAAVSEQELRVILQRHFNERRNAPG